VQKAENKQMGGNIPLRDASVLPSMPGNLRGLSFLLASSLCPPNAEKKDNKAQRGGPALLQMHAYTANFCSINKSSVRWVISTNQTEHQIIS